MPTPAEAASHVSRLVCSGTAVARLLVSGAALVSKFLSLAGSEFLEFLMAFR